MTPPAFAPPAMERALPQTCPVCARSIDVVDAPSLRIAGQCVRCRLAEPAPTRALRVKDAPGVELSFPPERSDRAACSIPTGFCLGHIYGGDAE